MENDISEITLEAVENELRTAGLRFRDSGKYLVSQCPLHGDQTPSAQIFKDDWFVNCLAGCGRFPLAKAFPQLRNKNYQSQVRSKPIDTPHQYETFELIEEHGRLPLIPRDHVFKGLPLEVLDDLGWRWDEAKSSYFIPYFNETKTSIPFAQWRHLHGERRFTFLAGARPTLYGKWNIPAATRLFIVEGSSDGAVLQFCGAPFVSAPSASSGSLLQNFARHAKALGIGLIFAGDNDRAGDALRVALDDAHAPYRVCQPPSPFKDWGEMFEALGRDAVAGRLLPYLNE